MAFSTVDQHMLSMAFGLGQQTEGKGKKHGCIIAKGNKVIAQGINQQLEEVKGMPEDRDDEFYASINAELVALAGAIGKANLSECTVYTSACPTWWDFKVLVALGVRRFAFYGQIASERTGYYAQKLSVEMMAIGQ